MNAISVLDAGLVRLIDNMGSDLSIVRNARVSYDAAWRAGENENSDARLIEYLMRNGHNTPFEAVTITFEVKAPIFVVRQWHRHRTQSYNEISARYKELPEEYYVPDASVIGYQAAGNKQCRDVGSEVTADHVAIEGLIDEFSGMAFDMYHHLLEQKCPRELARLVLPLNTYTHMFATMNLHNLFGFLRERLHNHAQYEIRQYACAMLALIKPIVPVAVATFIKTLSEKEGYQL